MITDRKPLYVVYSNTDRSEGRGREYPFALCEYEVTANRLAKGCHVQGTDGPILKVDAVMFNNRWFVPIEVVKIERMSADDQREHDKIEKMREHDNKIAALLKKMLDNGFNRDEIQFLKNVVLSEKMK